MIIKQQIEAFKNQHNLGTKKWSLCIKQITNLKKVEYFLKK